MRLTQDLIDRIRDSTDIVDLISGYVQLERKGGNWFGLCPFHGEKTASFSVHPGKGIFHCFGCGVGGNAFTFLQLHDKLSFHEAARELARRAGITLPGSTGWSQRAAGAGQVRIWLGSPYQGLVPSGTYGSLLRHSIGEAARLPGTSAHG